MYRNGQISIDCSILNALINNMRLAKFFMLGLRKFVPNIDEVRILIISFHFRLPIIKKVEQLQRLILVVWQRVRLSMKIY